jgi:hypothetical protein
MKRACFAVAAMAAAFSLPALPSYYGLNGLAFVPWARTAEAGGNGLAVTSAPAPFSTFTLYPFSARAYFTPLKGLEVGLSNTYRFFANYKEDYGLFQLPGGGFVAGTSNTAVPIVPSIKFSFEDKAVPNGSLAAGFEYPFGIFCAIDYLLDLGGGFDLHFVTGISTTFVALYTFGGAEAGLPFGFALTLEGSYGGMTAYLTKPHEAFLAAGLQYAVNEAIHFDFVFRLDQDLQRRLLFGYHLAF